MIEMVVAVTQKRLSNIETNSGEGCRIMEENLTRTESEMRGDVNGGSSDA